MGDVCKYIQVEANNGCWALADRCGISQDDLLKYNDGDDKWCDNLILDQYVCCSDGDPPDFSPKPDDDGNCYVYVVQANDNCYDIAKANHIDDKDDIDKWNELTWGWMGCGALSEGANICLSEGDPPFPSPIDGAVCGPQKPDTKKPSKGNTWDWAELNPCPLNACCDKWGQCGITPEFCTNTTEHGGAPGTSKNGTNGCISNCGTEVKSTSTHIGTPMRIGYFEAWNLNRPCANMDISKMTDGDYTHVHWAFGNITESWEVDVSGLKEQFDGLKKLKDIKRIMSFGGWGFSTEPYTHQIFRNGVKDGNRQTLAANVAKFINDNDLDGVDFDWEYPGAQDIPGIEPDSTDSGKNYAAFLKLVREKLDDGKSMSMALPASYWYLKGFDPLDQFDETMDYYVYMTYDLHGQWDYDNKFVNPGCSDGNCLRSHVNKTETEYALAMVTKAGLPSIKVVPGLALYGRSFEMTDPKCKGPECTFTGKESTATKGKCTDTAGYLSNVEIMGLIGQSDSIDNPDPVTIEQYEDEGDIIIYNKNQWVSWLTPDSYRSRQAWYDDLHFGGSVDWAADLNRTYSNNGTGDLEETGEDWPTFEPCPSIYFPYLEGLQNAIDSGGIAERCIPQMTLGTLISMLDRAYDNYTDINNGYDEMYDYYVKYIEKVVPSVLNYAFMLNMTTTKDNQIVPDDGYGMQYFDCQFPEQDDWVSCAEWDDNLDPLWRYIDATELKLRDEDGFDKALAKAGLMADWVDFGDWSIHRTNMQVRPVESRTLSFHGWPIRNESMVVSNPKDIVTKGLPDIPGMRADMEATMVQIMAGSWVGGDPRDAAVAYTPAVLMLEQAVDSMAQAKELGEKEEEEEEEEERKRMENIILLVIGVVLMFVPVVGSEVAAGLGFANLARVIAIAGELGNAALATYETVEDPSSAVVNMLGMLFGAGQIAKVARDAKGLGKVAQWRKGMKTGEITSLGKIFEDGDGKVQALLGKVCKM